MVLIGLLYPSGSETFSLMTLFGFCLFYKTAFNYYLHNYVHYLVLKMKHHLYLQYLKETIEDKLVDVLQ